MRFHLVLFDLDGVLIDSRENMRAAWAHVCKTFGFEIPFENYFAEIGLPFAEIIRRIGAPGDPVEIAAAYSDGSIGNFDLIRMYPGVAGMLEAFSRDGVRTGIVTSKDAARTERALSLIGAGFDVVRPPGPGLAGKPAPDQLIAAAQQLGIDADGSVYVGDMAVDREAAANAGMAYAHAAWGYGAAPPDSDYVFTSPAELAEGLLVD